MKPINPDPVKLFIGILFSDAELLEKAFYLLSEKFGEIDFTSPEFHFNTSDYYKEEMGVQVTRIFISFTELINPGNLAKTKIVTNKIEDRLVVDGKRKVNLDPGYMDYSKVILASAKYNGQKIYLNSGIYADPALLYEKGTYLPFSCSFPDFKTGQYNETFMRIRTLYKAERKKAI